METPEMVKFDQEALSVLRERRDWLTARIAAKKSINWETQWDERECASLTWAIDYITDYKIFG